MQNDLFEKWYIENHPHSSLEKCEKGSYFRKKAILSLQSFQAGAQSRQTEIDKLRKRIDEIKKHIENEKWFDEYGDYHCSVIEIIEILKGTTMNLERETLSGFNFDFLSECFYIKDGVLFWRKRPLYHFKSERAFNVFNSRYSDKPSGRINHGYMQTKIGGKILQNHRIIFFMINGFAPEIVDHIDGDSLNNNINNLRSTTVSKNAMNCRTSVKNTSGRKGVYFHRKISKYTASIRVNGVLTHLGTFVNFEDAVNARAIAEKRYYGEFSNDR